MKHQAHESSPSLRLTKSQRRSLLGELFHIDPEHVIANPSAMLFMHRRGIICSPYGFGQLTEAGKRQLREVLYV